MVALDYNTLATSQFQSIDKRFGWTNKIFNLFGQYQVPTKILKGFIFSLLRRKVRSLNKKLTEIFVESKGILSSLQEKVSLLDDNKIQKLISTCDRIVLKYSQIDHSTEEIIGKGIADDVPEILESMSLIKETISVNYDIIRLLKRYSKKNSIETTPLALESNARSLNSLQTVMNGRRRTT